MRKAILVGTVALGVCVLGAGPGCGQTAAPVKAGVQPKPEELLRRMAEYVCGLPAFSCKVEMSVNVEAQGHKNETSTNMTVRLQRPNKLALVIESGAMGMTVISDGKEMVQFFPSLNRYVITEAPVDFSKWNEDDARMLGTLGAMLPADSEQLYKRLITGVTGSQYLGVTKVDDVETHHLKFLQEDFNWEIWIQVGREPLVRKFVPDYSQRFKDQEGMKLEYVVTFAGWDIAPKFTAADFKFEPPADAERVDSLAEAFGGEEEAPHLLLGKAAPTFETVDLEGKAIELKSHLGKNVVMLDFWATWCGPCVAAMPKIDAVAKKFADQGLVFYAVNVGEDADTIKSFLESSKLESPVAMDQENKISGLYRAEGIPQTVLIGKDGKVQVVHVGYSDSLSDELASEVEDLLKGKDLATGVLAKYAEAKKKRAGADADAAEASGGATGADGAVQRSDENATPER